MPELPEVETVCRGLKPRLLQETISKVIIRQSKLRWIVPPEIKTKLPGTTLIDIQRRGKYILMFTPSGTLIIHLGMSGRVLLLNQNIPFTKHDHVDIYFGNGHVLRYRDPRRFGCILWTEEPPLHHPLLRHLGPEPLSKSFTGKYLYQLSRKRKIPIKSFLMDNKTVVGIGNIYASEALFLASIHPLSIADKLNENQYIKLAQVSKQVLKKAIQLGGTTINDFANPEGNPGYFSQKIFVYGRDGAPCQQCQTVVEKTVINQRSSFYCPNCQPHDKTPRADARGVFSI